MFTGIIEETGIITNISPQKISVKASFSDVKAGDSIAVNGVCLTVTAINGTNPGFIFDFDLSPETYEKTTFKKLRPGTTINLERAMAMGGRFGGHIVSGHVEAVTTLKSIKADNIAGLFKFNMPKDLSRYIIYKGSVTIDGVSLTVANLDSGSFTVAVIPQTLENTNFKLLKQGWEVNIETDILAKYVENMFVNEKQKNKITPEFLKENGF